MSKNKQINQERMTYTHVFDPVGSSHELQDLITKALHYRVIEDGRFTLAELGFLHQIMVSYCENRVSVKIYFHPKLATVQHRNINNKAVMFPRPELEELFKDYLYVGDIRAVVSYDTLPMPKCYIEDDELGRPALRIKKSDKVADMEVMVLNCNFPITMAFANDIDLADPRFSTSYETVGATSKNVKGQLVLNVGAKQEFPVSVKVQCTNPAEDPSYTPYRPENAVPYLIAMASMSRQATNNQKKLGRKVSRDAEKIKKEQTIANSAAYLRNR